MDYKKAMSDLQKWEIERKTYFNNQLKNGEITQKMFDFWMNWLKNEVNESKEFYKNWDTFKKNLKK